MYSTPFLENKKKKQERKRKKATVMTGMGGYGVWGGC
jgi:hypothetical protein